MTTFNVLTNSACCTLSELQITLQSFAKMYHYVTAKHQRKMRLVFLSGAAQKQLILPLIKQYKLTEVTDILPLSAKKEQISQASILFQIGQKDCSNTIQTAIQSGLPVIAYDGMPQRMWVDPSCGMLLPAVSEENSVQQFAQWMQMLYFDPWARKMLRKGAKRRFLQVEYGNEMQPAQVA